MPSDQPFTVATPNARSLQDAGAREARLPNPDGLSVDLRAAMDSLGSCIAGSAADFAAYYRDAWVYGIVLGWGCDDAHGDPGHVHDDICGGDAAMVEVAARHRWSDSEVERLRRYHSAWLQAEGRR